MIKLKPNKSSTLVNSGLRNDSTAIRTTDTFLEIGKQDMVYWQWWASIRRTIASFFTERAKRLQDSPDVGSKTPLTVTEQINLFDQLQRMGTPIEAGRYGSYPQEPVTAPMSIIWSVAPARKSRMRNFASWTNPATERRRLASNDF